MYYSGLMVVNYERQQKDLLLKEIMNVSDNNIISMFYERQNPYQVIKELSYYIGNSTVDLENIHPARQDRDLIAFSNDDAQYIRKEIQINNEDLYFLSLYVMAYDSQKEQTEYIIKKLEGLLQSRGIQTKRSYFRQEQIYFSCLPLFLQPKEVQLTTKRNVLTNGMLATYPFFTSALLDEGGVFVGINAYNNSLIFLDRFETKKYKNANLCIFGTSGAGKSYFAKTLVLRSRLLGIEQYIIDPDREYDHICESLQGLYIKIGTTSETYLNILDIRKESIEQEGKGYLATKMTRLLGFFHLMYHGQEEEKELLEEKLIECYAQKGITFDDSSLYQKENEKFKTPKQMPILEDLYYLLEKEERLEGYRKKLIPFVKGSLQFFNHHTNVQWENKLIVADIYDLGEENITYGMYLFTEFFWDCIKKDRKKNKIIYLDEIWKLIGITSNKEVASFIYKIFKTIRKYGGSAVAITQDISDLFSLENGTYGKSILNNTSIKALFELEQENMILLQKYMSLSEKERIEIKTLKTGECLLMAGENHVLAKVITSQEEHKIIEGGIKNEEGNNSFGKS